MRNRYRVIGRLGQGGMGTVYEARDELLGGVPVALKCLWPSPALPRGPLLATLRREFRILATLKHPLLCRVYDFGGLPAGTLLEGAPADSPGYFLARELVAGDDLSSVSERSVADICQLFAAAAAGLDVLHRAGLRHGDFKPANAIVCGSEVRLIDFGLTASEDSTDRGGTLAYAAPEIFEGRPIDRRADLYALGVALYEVLVGELPFASLGARDVLGWHARGQRPAVNDYRPEASEAVSDLVRRLMDPDPSRRLPTAAETEAALLSAASNGSSRGAAVARPSLVIEPIDRGIAARSEIALLGRCQRRGGPAVLEIVGAPGSGRTAVLTELAWRAELAGVEIVRGDSTRRDVALAALTPALDQLAAIVGVPLVASNVTDLIAALRAITVPVAILVDDVDYADVGSRALLAQIAASLPSDSPLAIAVVRSESSPPLTWGVTSAEFVCHPLDSADVATLAERALGRADPRLSKRLGEHTDGNLLHVVATLKALVESGHPATALGDLPMPRRLVESTSEQLAAIPRSALSVVRALAVLGPSTAAAIAKVTDAAEDEVEAALLLAEGFVRRERDGRYQFARTSLARATVAEMEPARRSEIHRRAAIAFESGQAIGSRMRHQIGGGLAADVANGVHAAIESLIAAGDQAGALELGVAALELLEENSLDAVALRVELGELARLAGDIGRACTLLEPVLAADEDGAHSARAALALGRALDAGGDPERAELFFVRAAEGGGEIGAQALRDHAGSLLRRGKSSEALALATSRDEGDALDPHLAVAAAYARSNLGIAEDAVGTLAAMAEQAAAAGDRGLQAIALHLAGLAAYRAGDWRTTRDFQERALLLADAVGDVIRVGTLRMNLAAMDQSEGAWASALERGGQAAALLRAAGARTFALMARRNHAQLLLEIGATEQARRELEGARGEAIELELEVHAIGIDALLGILAARSGEVAIGRVALVRAEARFRQLGDDRRANETLLDLVELELDIGEDPNRAAAILRSAAEEATISHHPARRARVVVDSALAAALVGDAALAAQHLCDLDAALDELETQKAEPLRAEIHRRAARAAHIVGDETLSERHRELALAIVSHIGAALLPEQRLTFWQDPRRRELRRVAQHARTAPAELTPPSATPARRFESERVFQLLAIYSQLSAEENPDKLLTVAIEQAALLVGASRGFILLSREGELVMVASRNLPDVVLESIRLYESSPATLLPGALPYSRTVAEEVFRTGQPIIGDIRADERFAGAASVHSLAAPSVLCVPACAGGEVVGALYLESQTTELVLGPMDARLLAAFGDQVAVLLREAELKRQLKARATELERAQSEVEALLAERTRVLAHRTEELSIAVRENSKLSRALARDGGAFGLVGSSAPMERLYELIERVASADVPALILGESGTGKELVARAIHARSNRSGKPMVAINCGALPQTLLESELFGHVRGSFTGATRDRQGLFETADGSTLFLDEVSETPPRMQAALLRAIQEGVIRPVGGDEIEVDVRVVGASNRDLHELAERGEFREDLLYRLEVVTLQVPPLRERRSDIALLCEHFLTTLRTRTRRADLSVSSEALRLLFDHSWPGNVRELEHALTSAAVMAQSGVLGASDFSRLLGPQAAPVAVREKSERAEIVEALEQTGWNRSKAARVLGMPRRTFYRRLAKFGIQ